jgi:aspartyl-tRNA(Asn)/glutamyl-tRNA(Gln) amidotransferase subunit C
MAKLTDEDVLKLARLARLSLTPEEVSRYKKEISSILDYVEQLQKVDTSGLQPTYQVSGLTNVVRPDEEFDYGAGRDELLMNAPAIQDGHFKVKRMIE